jgi:4-diphosphocytidyl-2-C-methyl-D-erythritol kinase
MHVLAPAKLNLYLRVGPRNDDGFHPLMTWMVTIGLFDTLNIERGAQLRFTCDDPSLPCDGRNLVVRAVDALVQQRNPAGADPEERLPLQIHLQKGIPHGSGLGGGSSDAASAILAANELLELKLPHQRLSQVAASVGSDVPFFLYGPSSVCTGRGEIVQPVAAPAPAWAVVVLPTIALSTAAVYRRFDELNAAKQGGVGEDQPDWQELAGLSAAALLPRLVNDLESAAFDLEPSLAALRSDIEQSLQRPVRMSGSGSSLFTLYDEEPQAQSAARRIARDHDSRALPVRIAPRPDDALAPQYM